MVVFVSYFFYGPEIYKYAQVFSRDGNWQCNFPERNKYAQHGWNLPSLDKMVNRQ